MRDTDGDWNEIAARHPYYGVITDPKFLEPDDASLGEFFASGDREIGGMAEKMERFFGEFHPGSALDFGCGVGRLVIPMAKQAGRACGVDIADNMLRLAEKHARESGVKVDLSRSIPTDRQFDWVNSVIVLQHIPPARGYEIIGQLWKAVAPRGFLSLQITIFKDQRFREAVVNELGLYRYDGQRLEVFRPAELPSGSMSMFDYDLGKVLSIIELQPAQQIMLEKTDHGGSHGFYIFARKP